MKVYFTDAARFESMEAHRWYLERSEKAAEGFLTCLEQATEWIAKHPATGRPLSERTRRHLMKVFPYLVIYRILQDAIWIIGVVHEKRDPHHWRHLL
ncbi:MAG: type II toxin-antitoxin system RelE/ParE family toxin [Verrucomicrobiaceae bacterium]|jgi:toxin ParE1/3/4|nr:type II toxin-antitoxin system RelE/ParE family toxin [Verrucomicrobiaceae bacterium]